jgi:2-polyprenyl-3-methyl-5-hydroxy-6-metoxy-1,4-benzoquinol methylase
MQIRRNASALQREVWTELGRESPDWAVLTTSRDWAENQAAFYASGCANVENALRHLSNISRHRALDFGAGTGRLSFALASSFDEVCAIDHSATMRSELTRRVQVAGLNVRVLDELPEAEAFDFVLSLLVLQHLPSKHHMAVTLSDLLDRVAPGGGFAIEVPFRPRNLLSYLQPRFHAYLVGRYVGVPARSMRRLGLSGMSMRHLPQDRVKSIISAKCYTLVNVEVRHADRWKYALYVGTRPLALPVA